MQILLTRSLEKKKGGVGGEGLNEVLITTLKERKKERFKMDPKLVQKKRMINGSTKKKE